MAKSNTGVTPPQVAPSERSYFARKGRYSEIESEFTKSFRKCEVLEREIEILETNIKERTVEIPSDKPGEKSIEVAITSIQLPMYTKLLAEKTLELKLTKAKLKQKGHVLRTVSGRIVKSTNTKIKNINNRLKLSREGRRKIDAIKIAVSQIVAELELSNDSRIAALKIYALKDGRKFYSEFQKLLRKEVTDANVKGMITYSSPVRTQLTLMVRTLFGWTPPATK